jgi:hypothetical protein
MLQRLKQVELFIRLDPHLQGLLLEAVAGLVIARTLLTFLPFRWLAALFDRDVRRRTCAPDSECTRRTDIRWAIEKASRRLPGDTACFARGIAAFFICHRRGIQATLYYGARATHSEGLTAHVWVQEGGYGVIGHQNAADFAVVRHFPGSHPRELLCDTVLGMAK